MRDINPVFMLSPENIKRYGCILFTQRNIRVNAIGMNFILIKKRNVLCENFQKRSNVSAWHLWLPKPFLPDIFQIVDILLKWTYISFIIDPNRFLCKNLKLQGHPLCPFRHRWHWRHALTLRVSQNGTRLFSGFKNFKPKVWLF